MPKVGELEFEYTKEGIANAKNYAKATGQKMEGDMSQGGDYNSLPISDARNRTSYLTGGEILPQYKEGGKVKGKKVLK